MPLKTLEPGVMGLISINKPHTVKIFDKHTKLIEWRKTPLPLGRYAVYEPKNGGGCGKVIGEFKVCDCTEYLSVDAIAPISIMMGQVSEEFLNVYAKGKPLYANLLCAVKKYDKPKELGEFFKPCKVSCYNCKNPKYFNGACELSGKHKIERPPQSWCRVIESTGGGE